MPKLWLNLPAEVGTAGTDVTTAEVETAGTVAVAGGAWI